MAYIRTAKRKKGTIYKAEIRIQGYRPLYHTFDRLSDPQRWAEDTEVTLRSGGYIGEFPPDDWSQYHADGTTLYTPAGWEFDIEFS